MSDRKDGLFGGLLLVTGAIIGAATTLLIKENRPLKAGLVLEKVKKQFNREGNVTGSWIDYDPIEYELFETLPLVYVGGVTLETDRGVNQQQFICDIYTGEILDSYIINQEIS